MAPYEAMSIGNFNNYQHIRRFIHHHKSIFSGFNLLVVCFNLYYISCKNHPNEKYVYAIIFPQDFEEKFAQLDANGRIIHISKGYSLFAN